MTDARPRIESAAIADDELLTAAGDVFRGYDETDESAATEGEPATGSE